MKKEMLRKRAVLALGAAVYALLFALCSQIDRTGSVTAGAAAVRFVLAYPAAIVVLWALFMHALPRLERGRPERGNARLTLGVFAFLLGCYGAMLIVHYPGSFMYDTQRQVFQIARNDYELFHPLAHTLLIRACLSLRDVLG